MPESLRVAAMPAQRPAPPIWFSKNGWTGTAAAESRPAARVRIEQAAGGQWQRNLIDVAHSVPDERIATANYSLVVTKDPILGGELIGEGDARRELVPARNA